MEELLECYCQSVRVGAVLRYPECFTPCVANRAGGACSASTKAGVLSWLLFVGALTSLGMAHPACVTACALGQTDGTFQFLLSFHQLQGDPLV